MRHAAREWHRTHPDFTLDVLNQMGRAQEDTERRQALMFHAEALDIGFWSKKDIVQYVVASLHAKAGMINVPSFRQYVAQHTEADEDIIDTFIQAQPVHYWTYVADKAAGREELPG